ncbi:MAG TPA: hypothetical protein VG961_04530, partial [Ignavibacteria bacterium]|nr:hypothetical protein [Ignavibacteria bacterium]
MKSAKYTLAAIILFLTSNIFSQSAIDTTWNGAIDIMGTKIGIGVKFTTTGKTVKAVMDIPEQSAMGLELEKVSFSNPKIHFEL